MSADILDRVYDAYTGEMGQPLMRATHRRVHWMCNAARGTRILDVGCSQGLVPILLAREGKEVVGIDSSPQAIRTAESHLASEAAAVKKLVTFLEADLAQHAFGEQRFDCVLMGEVLEHLIDPERLVAAAARLLDPGGRLVVTVPFGINDHLDHKRTFYLREPYGLLAQEFEIEQVDMLGKWLGLIGVKRPHGLARPEQWPDPLLARLEAAFLEIQRGLVDELSGARSRLDEAHTKYRSSAEELSRLKLEAAHADAEYEQASRARGELESRLEKITLAAQLEQNELRARLEQERESRHERELRMARLEERLLHTDQLRQREMEMRDSEFGRLDAESSETREKAQAEVERTNQELQRLARYSRELEIQLTASTKWQRELEAERAVVESLQKELGELRARCRRLEEQGTRAKEELEQAREQAARELELMAETQRGLLSEAEGKLAQARRDLEETCRAERRAQTELKRERRDKLSAERRAAQTRDTLSFRLGHELIHGFKSTDAMIALPRNLWELNREAARRRAEKLGKHEAPIRNAAVPDAAPSPPADAPHPVPPGGFAPSDR